MREVSVPGTTAPESKWTHQQLRWLHWSGTKRPSASHSPSPARPRDSSDAAITTWHAAEAIKRLIIQWPEKTRPITQVHITSHHPITNQSKA